ncbi:MAG: RNA polymerase sigma factor, partial [Limisphaerales bacterium]
MHEPNDMQLLRQFAEENSDTAFATLVTRHVNLVYSAALRKTSNAHAAEEISQAVFIILAEKAASLRRDTVLSGWLHQTARLTAANFLRHEIRRAHREQEAYMQSLSNESDSEIWLQIAPHLDDALGHLGEKDRNAIALRFFEGKSFQEVGTAFGASENAAKKRVAYALEKLRKYFSKRGVVSTTVIIAGVVSANSVQAAPSALAKTISVVALAKGAAAGSSTLTLVKGALKIMAWTKTQMAIVVGVGVLLA